MGQKVVAAAASQSIRRLVDSEVRLFMVMCAADPERLAPNLRCLLVSDTPSDGGARVVGTALAS